MCVHVVKERLLDGIIGQFLSYLDHCCEKYLTKAA